MIGSDDINVFLNTDEFAVMVSYNNASIPGIFTVINQDNKEEDAMNKTARLIISQSHVASPQYRDKIVYNGETWYVLNIEYSDGQFHELNLYRDERPRL